MELDRRGDGAAVRGGIARVEAALVRALVDASRVRRHAPVAFLLGSGLCFVPSIVRAVEALARNLRLAIGRGLPLLRLLIGGYGFEVRHRLGVVHAGVEVLGALPARRLGLSFGGRVAAAVRPFGGVPLTGSIRGGVVAPAGGGLRG